MARYVVRLAKSAGLVILFVLAAVLGTVSGVLFAFAGDLPQISALDDYAPSTITRVYGSHGEVVGEFSTQRRVVVPYEAISPQLRQAIIAAEDAEFEKHLGLSIPHIVMAATRDVLATACAARSPAARRTAARREHDHPAARARALPRGGRLPGRRRQPRAQDQGSDRRDPDREALHQARDPRLLRQPDVSGRRRLRRRGRVAHLLRQAREGSEPRRGRDHRRASSRRGATRRRRTWSARSGASPTSSSRWRTRATSRRRKPTTRRRARSWWRPPPPARTRSRRTSSKRSARSWKGATARRRSTRTASACRPRSTCRLQDAANRAIDEGVRRVDHIHGFRKPRRNVIDERHTIDGFKHPRWDRPFTVGDIVPAVVSDVDAASIRLRAGRFTVDDRQEGLRVDAQDAPAQLVRKRRPRRSQAADARSGRAHGDGVAGSAAATSKPRPSRSTTAPGRSS